MSGSKKDYSKFLSEIEVGLLTAAILGRIRQSTEQNEIKPIHNKELTETFKNFASASACYSRLRMLAYTDAIVDQEITFKNHSVITYRITKNGEELLRAMNNRIAEIMKEYLGDEND